MINLIENVEENIDMICLFRLMQDFILRRKDRKKLTIGQHIISLSGQRKWEQISFLDYFRADACIANRKLSAKINHLAVSAKPKTANII